MFRQFASASSSVQRLVVITVRDLASTVATGFTAATLTGAGTIITGTKAVARLFLARRTSAKAGEPRSRCSDSGATENFYAPTTVLCAFGQCGSQL
jgi:hypothetical protein